MCLSVQVIGQSCLKTSFVQEQREDTNQTSAGGTSESFRAVVPRLTIPDRRPRSMRPNFRVQNKVGFPFCRKLI